MGGNPYGATGEQRRVKRLPRVSTAAFDVVGRGHGSTGSRISSLARRAGGGRHDKRKALCPMPRPPRAPDIELPEVIPELRERRDDD